jgi:hypothetical protein
MDSDHPTGDPMTTPRPRITAYCLDWHITTSSAFMELLVNPLAPYADIRLTAWDGHADLPIPPADEITIFCQLPPTEKWLEACVSPVVWIPMADAIYYPPNIDHHPHVRIVAFSEIAKKTADRLGLPVFPIRYYVNPEKFPPASFDGERVMLYWNRTGLFYRRFLIRLCRVMRINRLIFRSAIDPRVDESAYYELPAHSGITEIETHPTLTSHADYLALLNRANIFIAPRKVEGVGIAFLEAMARGCCVIAYDGVTMNDYIQHGKNGILIPAVSPKRAMAWRVYQVMYRILNKLSWKIRKQPYLPPFLTMIQDWRELASADIAQLGANARQSMSDGYAQWLQALPQYADFMGIR